MNYQQKLLAENRLIQTIKHTCKSGSKEGYVKIWASNTLEHEEIKLRIAYKLKKQGFKIWTEAEVTAGGRADVVAIKDGRGYIIEVLHSETIKQFSEKESKYPSEFELIPVRTNNFNLEEFEV